MERLACFVAPIARCSFLAQRARVTLLIVVAVAATGTLLVALLPGLSFGYQSLSAHVAIEAGGTVAALVAAALVYGRLMGSGSSADLILTVGLLVLGLGNLARAFAPSYTGENNVVVWAPLTASVLVGGGALAAAAFAPAIRLRHPDRRLLYIAGLILATGATVAVVAVLADQIPTGIDPDLSPVTADHPRITGSPVLLSVQLLGVALFGAAAIGFANRAQRTGDELMAWLAVAAGLASLARLNYFLFPSIYSRWVFTGDILRGAAFIAILIGAFREITAHEEAAMRTAVVEERRRIARDLHDGLAQNLAYLSLQGRRLGGEEEGGQIAHTAREALFEARTVIANLRLSDDPLAGAVIKLARTLTARNDTRLELDVDEKLDARANERDDLLRILSEAISNAVRHGDASEICVSLTRRSDTGLVMRIADDGRGFDPAAGSGPRDTAGLEGMRARVERLGGHLQVRSQPRAGTTVEVVLDEPRKRDAARGRS
jgi:signal transduction histidine kinase